MTGDLVVIEKDDAYLVVWGDDLDDWVAIFLKTRDFPALQWAKRMVDLNNKNNKKRDAINKPTLNEQFLDT